jgi:hypothetical protein
MVFDETDHRKASGLAGKHHDKMAFLPNLDHNRPFPSAMPNVRPLQKLLISQFEAVGLQGTPTTAANGVEH